MRDFFENLFKPLDARYCNYFFYLSVISFVVLCVTVGGFVLSLVKGKSKLRVTDMILIASQPLILYFVNRLNYSMCVNSLK